MSIKSAKAGTGTIVRTVIVGAVFTTAVVLSIVWLAGGFARKIGAVAAPERQPAGPPVGDVPLVAARVIRVPATESAVGTIRAVHETAVASKLLAKVVEVNVQAGQHVAEDETLVRLDDEDLKARVEQADAALRAAGAAREQAQIELDRVKDLFEQSVASRLEFQRRETALKAASADLDRAEQTLREAQAILDYATIRSHFTGVVIDKQVDVGDTVTPGQILLTLFDPTRMQLVARVRESLTRRLEVGQTIAVQIDALDKTCEGRVSEIVPESEAASRTFAVKVTGPCPPGVFSGMFGRLLIPLDEEEVLVIPDAAVRRVGQLHIVDVAENGFLRRRVVQLGRAFGGDVEFLAGLRAGERVALPRPNKPAADGT